nr:MAG TPA: hypothetical protein [Caudoviricetes sp.]
MTRKSRGRGPVLKNFPISYESFKYLYSRIGKLGQNWAKADQFAQS